MHVSKSSFTVKGHFIPFSKICSNTGCFVLDWKSEVEFVFFLSPEWCNADRAS